MKKMIGTIGLVLGLVVLAVGCAAKGHRKITITMRSPLVLSVEDKVDEVASEPEGGTEVAPSGG